jgi:hypothetical protein
MPQSARSLKVRVDHLETKTDRLETALLRLTEQVTLLTIDIQEFKNEMRAHWECKEKEWERYLEEERKYREQKEKEWERHLEEEHKYREQKEKEWERYFQQKEKELQSYKEQKEREIKELNKKWGDLVNKWGTMVEDIIVPGIPAVLERRYGFRDIEIHANVLKRIGEREREYDVFVITGEFLFLINVKSKFKNKHFGEFEEALRDFSELFPDLAKRYKIVPVISAFNFEKGTINKATKKGWLALQMSGDYLDFVNADKVKLP